MGRKIAILTVSLTVIVTVLSASKLHSFIATLPGTLVFPVGQLAHETDPVDTANLPCWHWSQVGAPNAGATFPGAHLEQPDEPAEEKEPGAQSKHADTAVEALGDVEYFPAPQLSHAVLTPAKALYLPAVHPVHSEEPCAAEYLPAPHSSHAMLIPVEALCFPASQSSHAVLTPAEALNLPAAQCVHV